MHWVCCVEPEWIYPILSATHRFPPNCPGPGKGSCLVSLPCVSLLFFFGHVMCLAGSQFPDQGLNPSHRSESSESYPLGYQGTPSSCVSCGICSWLLGVSAGFSSWQSWELGPLERAGCPVCVCFCFPEEEEPKCHCLPGSWARVWLERVWTPTGSILGGSKNPGHRATFLPSALQATAFGQPRPAWSGDSGRNQRQGGDLRAGLFTATLQGPQDPTPTLGWASWFVKCQPGFRHQLVCCPFIVCSCGQGKGGPTSRMA